MLPIYIYIYIYTVVIIFSLSCESEIKDSPIEKTYNQIDLDEIKLYYSVLDSILDKVYLNVEQNLKQWVSSDLLNC